MQNMLGKVAISKSYGENDANNRVTKVFVLQT